MGLAQECVRLLRAACPAGPAEKHPEGHEALLDTVVEVPLDPPAFRVHRLDDRCPAGGQVVDALPQQVPFGGAEAFAGEARVQGAQRAETLDVEKEQHSAEGRLQEQFVPAEGTRASPTASRPARTMPKPSSATTTLLSRPA